MPVKGGKFIKFRKAPEAEDWIDNNMVGDTPPECAEPFTNNDVAVQIIEVTKDDTMTVRNLSQKPECKKYKFLEMNIPPEELYKLYEDIGSWEKVQKLGDIDLKKAMLRFNKQDKSKSKVAFNVKGCMDYINWSAGYPFVKFGKGEKVYVEGMKPETIFQPGHVCITKPHDQWMLHKEDLNLLSVLVPEEVAEFVKEKLKEEKPVLEKIKEEIKEIGEPEFAKKLGIEEKPPEPEVPDLMTKAEELLQKKGLANIQINQWVKLKDMDKHIAGDNYCWKHLTSYPVARQEKTGYPGKVKTKFTFKSPIADCEDKEIVMSSVGAGNFVKERMFKGGSLKNVAKANEITVEKLVEIIGDYSGEVFVRYNKDDMDISIYPPGVVYVDGKGGARIAGKIVNVMEASGGEFVVGVQYHDPKTEGNKIWHFKPEDLSILTSETVIDELHQKLEEMKALAPPEEAVVIPPVISEIPKEKWVKPKPGAWYKVKNVDFLQQMLASHPKHEKCFDHLNKFPVVRNRKMSKDSIEIFSPNPVSECDEFKEKTVSLPLNTFEFEHLTNTGNIGDVAIQLGTTIETLVGVIKDVNKYTTEIYSIYNKKSMDTSEEDLYSTGMLYLDGKKGADIACIPSDIGTSSHDKPVIDIECWSHYEPSEAWSLFAEDVDLLLTEKGKKILEGTFVKKIKKKIKKVKPVKEGEMIPIKNLKEGDWFMIKNWDKMKKLADNPTFDKCFGYLENFPIAPQTHKGEKVNLVIQSAVPKKECKEFGDLHLVAEDGTKSEEFYAGKMKDMHTLVAFQEIMALSDEELENVLNNLTGNGNAWLVYNKTLVEEDDGDVINYIDGAEGAKIAGKFSEFVKFEDSKVAVVEYWSPQGFGYSLPPKAFWSLEPENLNLYVTELGYSKIEELLKKKLLEKPPEIIPEPEPEPVSVPSDIKETVVIGNYADTKVAWVEVPTKPSKKADVKIGREELQWRF